MIEEALAARIPAAVEPRHQLHACPAANPSLTTAALALWLADHLAGT